MRMVEFTPKGRLKTCPYIQLYGKEWKALSEIRNSQVASVQIQMKRLEVEQKNNELLNQLVELQVEKLHNQ